MLLGTLPVFFASIVPQTMVGALLSREAAGDASFWSALQTASTGIAAIAQAVASGVAAACITLTIERNHGELAQFREEHRHVAELTQRQAAYVQAWDSVSAWGALTLPRKLVIGTAAVLQLIVGSALAADYILFDTICFRKFEIASDIDASLIDGGLAGNVLNIVRLPIGVVILTLACAAVCLHLVHHVELRWAAKRLQTDLC